MGRKKQYLEDGYSSDSGSSSGSIQEGDFGRKRKRKSTKEDAIYGIFGSGSEGENERQGGAGRSVRANDSRGRKIDYLKGQSFVRGNGPAAGPSSDHQSADSGESDEGSSSSEEEDEEMAEEAGQAARQAEVEEIDADYTPRPTLGTPSQQNGSQSASFVGSRGGIGTRKSLEDGMDADERPQRGGLGSTSNTKLPSAYPTFARATGQTAAPPAFTKASTEVLDNSQVQHAVVDQSQMDRAGVPTTFGAAVPSSAFTQRKSREQSMNSNSRPASFVTPPTTSIKFGGGMGGKFDPSKYLAQMGWTGGGLGKQGEGIVNPIEVKQRPERAGIAFGGLKEKTKQAKEEARRRGEEVSTDEEERDRRKRKDLQRNKKKVSRAEVEEGGASSSRAWTRTEKKPRKPKIEHRSFEEILEEHGVPAAVSAGVGQILDAAGNEFDSVSAALAKHSVPSNESTNLVEIRHNLHLICEGNAKDLGLLAKEGTNIVDRHKWLVRDRDESQRRILRDEQEVKGLQEVLNLVRRIEGLGRESQSDPQKVNLASFDGVVGQIVSHHKEAIEKFNLDEALVGAIVPILRSEWSHWSPLESPEVMTEHFSRWRDVLRIESSRSDVMTPYETLLWNLWMPPVRSALNNHWNPLDAEPALKLYQSWKPLLSPFLVDNLTQQLILPKITRAVSEWDGKSPLHQILFPWMASLGAQMDDIVSEAKRRLRGSLKSWRVSKGIPQDLHPWREAKVFRTNEWNSMLLEHVIPKLSSYLDAELRIDMNLKAPAALETLLSWRNLLAPKILSKVLQSRFVPRWLHTLHSSLIDSRADLEEIAQWYEYWKAWFQSKDLLSLDSIQQALQTALQLMSKAVEMGNSRVNLPAPSLHATSVSHGTSHATNIEHQHRANNGSTTTDQSSTTSTSISFRHIVEEAMMSADLLMQSLNKRETKSGRPLYRISKNLDGKGGVTIYLDEDVVFIERRQPDVLSSSYEPISIQDVIKEVA